MQFSHRGLFSQHYRREVSKTRQWLCDAPCFYLTLTLRVLHIKHPPRDLRCALMRRFRTARLSSLRLSGESFLVVVSGGVRSIAYVHASDRDLAKCVLGTCMAIEMLASAALGGWSVEVILRLSLCGARFRFAANWNRSFLAVCGFPLDDRSS